MAFSDRSTFCCLIRPALEWTHWEEAAERIHGISPLVLAQYGRSLVSVAEEINWRLQGETVYTDGWANDYTWVNLLFEYAQMVPHFHMQSVRALLSEEQAGEWHVTKTAVQLGMNARRHRASTDARVVQETVLRIRHAPVNAVAGQEFIALSEQDRRNGYWTPARNG